MGSTTLIQLDRSDESSRLLACYFRELDNSYEPNLSSYIDIEAYSEKLIKHAYVVVLKEDDNLIGLYAMYINDSENNVAYLSSIGVLDKYKGLGYAQLLINEVVTTALKANMNQIRLEVKSTYSRAVKFYEKQGFFKSDEPTKDDSSFYMYMKL